MNKKGTALVVFDSNIPKSVDRGKYNEVIEAKDFIEPGSIYEGTDFVEALSYVKLRDDTRVSKSFLYKGYELWWMNINNLFLYFGLPYTQYKKLLIYLENFKHVYFLNPPFKSLFTYYLEGHDVQVTALEVEKTNFLHIIPFGIFLQILLTIVSIPMLLLIRPSHLVFTGDKFEKEKDFDFRYRFVYKELRERSVPFVEFIRSLESWRTVSAHALHRKRPVIYSEAILFMGKIFGSLSGKYSVEQSLPLTKDPKSLFMFLVATHYIRRVHEEIWAIRISKLILQFIGVKSAFFTAALDRNIHTVLGCKLNNIPTVGILHGAASKYYNLYDFQPGFDGQKALSLDKYGLWSGWWKQYYERNSCVYKPEQLFVSGPMRPIEKKVGSEDSAFSDSKIRVLFVSEQLAVPNEVLPYVETLLNQPDIQIIFTFRQHRDGFKEWLLKNAPQLLNDSRIKIAYQGLEKAIEDSDVAVGSHSTAVLEMLLREKIPIFFETKKWGDYYSLKDYDPQHSFFAEDPDQLVGKIRNIRSIKKETILDLQKRYFGNPYQNGSKWVVDQLISAED